MKDDSNKNETDIEKLTAGLENTRNINRKRKTHKFNWKLLIVVILLVVIVGFTNKLNKEQEELEKEPWAKECTSIDNFEYKIENNEINITKYKGNDKKIKICKTYIIDEKEYFLTSFTDNVFSSTKVFSVMLPYGIKELPSKIFEDSNIKYIFIPKSIEASQEEYQFSHYLEDVNKIYYEGTELDWKILTEYEDRDDINAKEIIYEAKSEDLK